MTDAEIRQAKKDFHQFLFKTLEKYHPNNEECIILYSSFISCLGAEITSWGYNNREERG